MVASQARCQPRRKRGMLGVSLSAYLWILVSLTLCSPSHGVSTGGCWKQMRVFSGHISWRIKVGNWRQRLFWKDLTSANIQQHLSHDKSARNIVLTYRGGSESNATASTEEDKKDASNAPKAEKEGLPGKDQSADQEQGTETEAINDNDARSEENMQPQRREISRMRHTSDMLQNLIERSAVIVPESVSLRELITQRSQDYLEDLQAKQIEAMERGRKRKLPHPNKVLHYLAPKIPAIKHSPDVNLRIQTARFDMDSGVAACLIGTVARVCERYDTSILMQNRRQQDEEDDITDNEPSPVAVDLVKDRRFEQLVECLACGVDVKKRKREYLSMRLDSKRADDDADNLGENDDIEELMEGDQVQVREGLNIRDACRAAWGLAILGAHHCGTMGGTSVMDLLMALSLRVRELLLSRLQMLFQGDLMGEITDVTKNGDTPIHRQQQTPEDRLEDLAEELAEDAAAAMWAFACVRACTGLRSDPLFETCCSILCRNPVELRKQALKKDEGSAMEVNDVVDRLAYSEAQISQHESSEATNTTASEEGTVSVRSSEVVSAKVTTGSEEKEALVDWLSPNELTDVLWALALHGHTDASTRGETVLSENGSALKEIAFDRLMELLREDFQVLDTLRQQAVDMEVESEGGLVHSTEEYTTKEGETMTVEVVDAAALLASENAAKIAVVTGADELTIQTAPTAESEFGSVEEVKLVDAATILRSSSEQVEQHEIMTSDQNVLVDEEGEQTAKLTELFSEDDDDVVSTLSESHNVVAAADEDLVEITKATAEQLYFSPHNLCSLAWAVTELRDSLKFQIVDLVAGIFDRLGEESFDTLGGADLSNLAWAIARQSNDARPWTSQAENPSSLQLTLWVVRRALIASGGSDAALVSQNIHLLDPFQPPELSRLMWAVAIVIQSYGDKANGNFPDVEDLAMNALVAASSNVSLFSAEDLVRILWAFLELCDMDDALSYPGVAMALGRIFASLESSITRWERGDCSSQRLDEVEADEGFGGFNAIASFFLRPRLSRQMLDQIIEEYNDLEEEDEKILSSITDGKRPRLPRLRDLNIDPNSLAKAAGGLAKLKAKHPNMRGTSILTRVILKLLTSKNGRLLHEFSMANLIRACEAGAINDSVQRRLDPVVGQFVRRFLQLLNEANGPANDSDSRVDLKLSSASPEEIATLLWSLGELGARHLKTDKDQGSAHRKLRLVMNGPLVTDDQLYHLSTSSTLKVLRGLVAMNEMHCGKQTITKVLELVEPMIVSMNDESDLCELVESVAVIAQSLTSEKLRAQMSLTNTAESNTTHVNSTATDANMTATPVESGHSTGNNATTTPSEFVALETISSRMLSSLASHSAEKVSNLKADSIRRLLGVFSLLPFQADDLINACEKEISNREALLQKAAATASVEDLLRQAAKNALAANTTVFGKDDDSSSTLKALKRGLKSIFSAAPASAENEDDEAAQEMKKFTEEVGGLLNKVTASVTKVDACMEQIGTASNVHTDTALQQIMEGANFELGCCRELIDNYRRIEFSTGRRKSRYNYERSRHIGKRLLSRLVPK